MSNKDTQFKSGNPGGPGRPPKEHSLTDLLKETLNLPYDESGKTKKQQIIDTMFDIAVNKGDVQMMKYLIDRVDGKPLQQIEANLHNSEPDKSFEIVGINADS